VLFGIVRDEAGHPLPGSTAELVTTGAVTATNDSGYFSFANVRGVVTVRVSKVGFAQQSQDLDVTADVVVHLALRRLALADTIVLGATIHSTVDAAAPPCDPGGWDAAAPCRRFQFIAPASGQLAISITWMGAPPLDATMVTANGTYLAWSTESGIDEIRLQANVEAGEFYEIRVNSYYGAQAFDLTANLNP
jgi:hypothetical protein